MSINSVSRRDILKTLTMGAMATSVLRVIPAHAAEYAHHMVAAEKLPRRQVHILRSFSRPEITDAPGAVPGHHSGGQRMRRRDSGGGAGIYRSADQENPEYQLNLAAAYVAGRAVR